MLSKENLAQYAFLTFGDMALQAAFCCMGNRQDAEDVAQEVFLKLHSQPPNIADDTHLKAWILRAVINRCTNLHRSVWRKMRVDLDTLPESTLTVQDGSEREILQMITELPQPYAEVVYLHDYEGYCIREIAELLHRRENTVSSQLRRGHAKLRMELTDSDTERSDT